MAATALLALLRGEGASLSKPALFESKAISGLFFGLS